MTGCLRKSERYDTGGKDLQSPTPASLGHLQHAGSTWVVYSSSSPQGHQSPIYILYVRSIPACW